MMLKYNRFSLSKEQAHKYLVVLLLATPALSVSGLLGLGFLPNEKLAILLVLFSKCSWNKRFFNLRIFGFIVAVIILMLTLTQYIFGNPDSIRANINGSLVFFSLPLYAAYFSKSSYSTFKAIIVVAVIQLCLSITQQLLMQYGFSHITELFNNYPPQKGYIYPLSEMGYFYRTSGLFTESSSYALFQGMAIISGIAINLHKKRIGQLIFLSIFLDILMNGSMLGYLFMALFFVFSGRLKVILYALVAIIIFYFTVNSAFDLNYGVSGLQTKISKNFESLDEGKHKNTRLYVGVRNVDLALKEYSLYGRGFSWNRSGWDFISVYLLAFGVIGFMFVSVLLVYFLLQAPFALSMATIGVLMINGHLSTSVNILLLSFCCLTFPNRLRMKESISKLLK